MTAAAQDVRPAVWLCAAEADRPWLAAALSSYDVLDRAPRRRTVADVVVASVDALPAPGADGPAVPLLAVDRRLDGLRLAAALQAGVQGYCALEQGPDVVATAVATVLDGHAYIPPALLGGLLHDLVSAARPVPAVADPRFTRLSRREREVLDQLALGRDASAIAQSLVISPQTARTHIQNVLSKLEVHSRLEAVALATEHRQLRRET